MKASALPLQLQRVALALFEKLKGSERTRFLEAFAIARSRLTEQGYLTRGSETGSLGFIRVTADGRTRAAKMKRDSQKQKRFEELFDAYHADIDAEDAGLKAEEDPKS